MTAIWLMPFQVSPHRDEGYDIADYYGVDPRYGTIGDFVEFTHAAKQRGIRMLTRPVAPIGQLGLIDLVINHTSINHSWSTQSGGIQAGNDVILKGDELATVIANDPWETSAQRPFQEGITEKR